MRSRHLNVSGAGVAGAGPAGLVLPTVVATLVAGGALFAIAASGALALQVDPVQVAGRLVVPASASAPSAAAPSSAALSAAAPSVAPTVVAPTAVASTGTQYSITVAARLP